MKKEYTRSEEIKELFSLVPILKSMRLSLDKELKRVMEYTADEDEDYIESMTFSNYEISDMPHSNTNAFHSLTESGALLYKQIISDEKKEARNAPKEVTRDIYNIEIVLDKIEIGFNSLNKTQQETLKLKYWEEKTWNEIIQYLKKCDDFYSKRQIQILVKKAISQVNIIAMIDIETYKKVKSLIERTEN